MTDHRRLCRSIFKRGSRTYYYSSLWFPRAVRTDVFTLYSFVRVADDFVDSRPADREGFQKFRELWTAAVSDGAASHPVIGGFHELFRRKSFKADWVEAFLDAMESDLAPPAYRTLEDTLRYIHGSAEVVGLMMASILGLPEAAHDSARMLGRSMQFINFIRDIDEDVRLGRSYFPQDDFDRFGLKNLDTQTALQQPDAFTEFVRWQLARYMEWQCLAEAGFSFIPRRILVPIKTASELYKWTGRRIALDPFLVYRKKLKPSVYRVLQYAAYESIFLARRPA